MVRISYIYLFFVISLPGVQNLCFGNLIFESGFEAGHTLICKDFSKDDEELVLCSSEDLHLWPESTGTGYISSKRAPYWNKFSYETRENNLLKGVRGLDQSFPQYTEARTIGFHGWDDVPVTNIELTSPGRHGMGCARINFDSTRKAAFMAKTLDLPAEFYCRFNVRFSREALENKKKIKSPKFIMGSLSPVTGIFRTGLVRDNDGWKFGFRFHLNIQKDDHNKFHDVYIKGGEPVTADKWYCFEYQFRNDSINGGAALWVDGKKVDQSFGHNTWGRGNVNQILLGVLTWEKFYDGHVLVDDIAFSDKRIGLLSHDLPGIKIEGDTVVYDTSKAAGIQIQISKPDKPWALCEFNSGSMTEPFRLTPWFPGLNTESDLLWRTKTKNMFGQWGEWTPRDKFMIEQKDTGDYSAGLIKDIYFISLDAIRVPPENPDLYYIIPGSWGNLCIQLGRPEDLKKISGVDMLLSHFQHTQAGFPRKGGLFFEKENYFFGLDLNTKSLWARFLEGSRISYELSGQNHKYVNDKEGQFKVDTAEGLIQFQMRISEKVRTGPWILRAYTYSSRDNATINHTYVKCVQAGKIEVSSAAPAPGRYFKQYLFVLVILGFFVLIILKFRPARKLQPSREDESDKKEESADAEPVDFSKSHVQRCQEIIEKNYQDPDLNMEKAADMLNISRGYLSSQFKKEAGKSFPQLLNEVRIKKAKELLSTTNLRISEIAFRVGYSTAEHFGTMFKKAEGVSPGDFRKRG
jgi:AraC-like DNA-binding protein